MPMKRIGDEAGWLRKFLCRAPGHNPPSHIVLRPGVYEHTCSTCGEKQIVRVEGAWV